VALTPSPEQGSEGQIAMSTQGNVYQKIGGRWVWKANWIGPKGKDGGGGGGTALALQTGFRYVDKANGNDTTGDGSLTSPWATLAKAMSEISPVAETPHVIYVAAGDYSNESTLTVKAFTSIIGVDRTTVYLPAVDVSAGHINIRQVSIYGSVTGGSTCEFSWCYVYSGTVSGNGWFFNCEMDNPTTTIANGKTQIYRGCTLNGAITVQSGGAVQIYNCDSGGSLTVNSGGTATVRASRIPTLSISGTMSADEASRLPLGTQASPTALATGATVNVRGRSTCYIQGSGGAVTGLLLPDGAEVGERVVIEGCDDTNTAALDEEADNLRVTTGFTLKKGSRLALIWGGTYWTEDYRNGIA
jgi:hypothetical protein